MYDMNFKITYGEREWDSDEIHSIVRAQLNSEGLLGVTSIKPAIRAWLKAGLIEERKIPLFNKKMWFLTDSGQELIQLYKSLANL